MGLDTTAHLTAPCDPLTLFPWIEDLGRYPEWMSLVHRVWPEQVVDGEPLAWRVELRGRLGPMARSKRLRMVRSECRPGEFVRFERREMDGRSHSTWLLEAALAPVGVDTRLSVRLHYGGSLWGGGVLERVLADHIESSSARLSALVVPPTR